MTPVPEPARPALTPPQRPPTRFPSKLSLRDVPYLTLIAVVIAAWSLVPRFYRPAPPLLFPKQPADFLPAAALDKIESEAKAVLEKDPENIAALTDAAVAAFQRGPEKYADCYENAERALSLGALDKRLFYYTGVAYEAKGLPEYAATAFEKYLRNEPDDLETRLRLGAIFYRSGDLDKAQAAFRAVLAARPGDSLVSFNLAVVLRDRQQWAEGLAVLGPVLERDKTLPAGGFRVLGDLRRGDKDAAGAVGAYQRELERSPDDADLQQALALSYDDMGRAEEALAAWKRVLDLSPKNNQAYTRVRALKRQARRAAGGK